MNGPDSADHQLVFRCYFDIDLTKALPALDSMKASSTSVEGWAIEALHDILFNRALRNVQDKILREMAAGSKEFENQYRIQAEVLESVKNISVKLDELDVCYGCGDRKAVRHDGEDVRFCEAGVVYRSKQMCRQCFEYFKANYKSVPDI